MSLVDGPADDATGRVDGVAAHARDAAEGPDGATGGRLPSGLLDPATVGVAAIVAAYLHVFLSITDVVGGSDRVILAVMVAALVGLGCSRLFDERTAVRVTVVLFAVGVTGYYFAVPESQRALFSIRGVFFDTVALLTGLSVLRLALADVWVLAVAPVPTFLIAYLTGRARHVLAAAVAGGTLGFFVLTGDAGEFVTLLGVLGAAFAAGAVTLRAPGGLSGRGDTLALLLAVMLVASATVTLIPAGSAQPWGADRGTPGLESTLVDDDELTIVGSTQLSPEVRFTIESDVESNWHAGAYDTYTGDGWVRSGEESPVDGPLSGPPGDAVEVESTVVPETEMRALPAPWQAVEAGGPVADSMQVDERGTLRPGTALLPGDAVPVESRVPDADPDDLREADTAYDDAIEDRYTQLPESTPERVGERTEEIVDDADAENPYDAAVAIESYLLAEYDYSLTVERPDGDVADAFLFEMDAGYCTYFATTMVAMLRSQGIPAQFVTGYGSGEQVSEDEWVVRGQDAHAWVQVYFPEHGWVEFDPTPSAERDQVRETRLVEARATGAEDVDIELTAPEGGTDLREDERGAVAASQFDDIDEADEPENGEANVSNVSDEALEGIAGEGPAPDELGADAAVEEGGEGPSLTDRITLPSRETLGYGLFLVVVVVAGAHHAGATTRAGRALRVRLPARRRTPTADVERAFADLERLLERRYRRRRSGETPREYLDALRVRGVDDRAHEVGTVYERAVYAGQVSREEADDARRTVRRLALEVTPVIGGLFADE